MVDNNTINELWESESSNSLPLSVDDETSADMQQAELKLKDQDIKDRQQDREQRKTFSMCIFGFVCIYMAATLTVIFLTGACSLWLSDTVLITLLSTTTANVLGLFVIVAKYLFHTKE